MVFRRGVSKELVVTIAELEPVKTSKAVQPAAEPKSVGTAQSMGLVVADLTDVQKKELKLKGGVRIESVAEASARSGLREGDVILSIANIEITQLRDFELAMNKIDKTKPFSVLFRRSDVAQYALIRPSR